MEFLQFEVDTNSQVFAGIAAPISFLVALMLRGLSADVRSAVTAEAKKVAKKHYAIAIAVTAAVLVVLLSASVTHQAAKAFAVLISCMSAGLIIGAAIGYGAKSK